MTPVQLQTASPAQLPALAQALAQLPLCQRYARRAADLQASWQAALTRPYEQVLTASQPTTDTALGICWFSSTGTFGRGAYLHWLAVHPSAQNQHIGSHLLHAFEQACSSAPHCFLLCSDFNHAAQRFYTRHGYQAVGHLTDYVIRGITEIIYCKKAPTKA